MRHLTVDGKPPTCPIDGEPLTEHWQVFAHQACVLNLMAEARSLKYGLGVGRWLPATRRAQLVALLSVAEATWLKPWKGGSHVKTQRL